MARWQLFTRRPRTRFLDHYASQRNNPDGNRAGGQVNAKLFPVVMGIVSALAGCAPEGRLRPALDGSPSSAATERQQDRQAPPVSIAGCASSRFFALYAREKLVQASSETSLVLDVPVDLHSADCGAPDCYGHGMTLTLELRRAGQRCEIARAHASAVPFNNCGDPWDQVPQPWTNNFVVQGAPDLADDRLARIELRDPGRNEALLLLPDGYYFYENADASSPLLPELESDDSKGCCYGYTHSALRWWLVEPQK